MTKDITSTRSMPLEVGKDYEMGFEGKIPLVGDVLTFRNITLKRSWEVIVSGVAENCKRFTIEVLKEL